MQTGQKHSLYQQGSDRNDFREAVGRRRKMVDQSTDPFNAEDSTSPTVLTVQKPTVTLFVDKRSKQWIVRDLEEKLWIIPSVDKAWEHRQPFELTEETQLELVPAHYMVMLGIPH
jgi:hypothetical protein